MSAKPPKVLLDVTTTRKGILTQRLRSRLLKAANKSLASLPKSLQRRCSLTLLLTDNRTIQALNRDFRGLDKPTNVLSFPQYSRRELTKMGRGGDVLELGDIAISYQYIVVEAKKEHKILINHLTHLLIHGLLHLFGYDHEMNAEALRMEGMETTIMAGLGLPDPYAPPAPVKGRAALKRTPRR